MHTYTIKSSLKGMRNPKKVFNVLMWQFILILTGGLLFLFITNTVVTNMTTKYDFLSEDVLYLRRMYGINDSWISKTSHLKDNIDAANELNKLSYIKHANVVYERQQTYFYKCVDQSDSRCITKDYVGGRLIGTSHFQNKRSVVNYDENESYFENEIIAGRFWTDDEEANKSKVVVINEYHAKKLFGYENPIEKKLYLALEPERSLSNHHYEEHEVTIIGVVREIYKKDYGINYDLYKNESEKVANQLYVPTHILKEYSEKYYEEDDKLGVGGIFAVSKTIIDENFMTQLSLDVSDSPILKKIDYTSKFELSTALEESLKNLIQFISMILYVALIIGFINILILFYLKASYKSKEITIKRVCGASKNNIMLQYLLEVVFIGLIAFIISSVIGIGIPFIIMSIFKLNPSLDFNLLIKIILIYFISLLIVAIIPSIKAYRTNIIRNLKSE